MIRSTFASLLAGTAIAWTLGVATAQTSLDIYPGDPSLDNPLAAPYPSPDVELRPNEPVRPEPIYPSPMPEPLQPDLRKLGLGPGEAASPAELFDLLDADDNGSVSRAEWTSRIMFIFYIRDANKDQYLQRDEIPGITDAEFAEADLDSDGQLSGYEFLQAPFTQFDDARAPGAIDVELVDFERFLAVISGEQ